MELNEIRKKVAESIHKEWLSTLSYDFPFRCSTGTVKKVGFSSIYDFVEQQIAGFEKIGKDLPSVLNNSKQFFTEIKKELIEFLKQQNQLEQKNLTLRWSKIGAVYKSNPQNPLWLFDFKSPETILLIDINKTIPGAITGAFNFLTGQKVEPTKFALIGAFKAYGISYEANKELKRSKGEKISLGLLSKRYEESLDKAEGRLIHWLSEVSQKIETFGNEITTLKSDKETVFTEWFNKSKEEFSMLSQDIDKRKEELEKTYEELLRLKKPAEYWSIRAKKLKEDGKKYLEQLIWLISIGGGVILFMLWKIPDGLLLNVFKGEASAIKWTLLYVTLVSFLIFGIKTLSKITYSSFHLARDAEEREQLTYVYISLKNESGVEEKDRQIILQSLFSRADTGLLKDDSSPTMPGIMDTVLKNNR